MANHLPPNSLLTHVKNVIICLYETFLPLVSKNNFHGKRWFVTFYKSLRIRLIIMLKKGFFYREPQIFLA